MLNIATEAIELTVFNCIKEIYANTDRKCIINDSFLDFINKYNDKRAIDKTISDLTYNNCRIKDDLFIKIALNYKDKVPQQSRNYLFTTIVKYSPIRE